MFLEFENENHLTIKGFDSKKDKLNNFIIKSVRLINSIREANNDHILINYLTGNIHLSYLI